MLLLSLFQCSNGGCLIELAQQLAVIMIGKQMINNAQSFCDTSNYAELCINSDTNSDMSNLDLEKWLLEISNQDHHHHEQKQNYNRNQRNEMQNDVEKLTQSLFPTSGRENENGNGEGKEKEPMHQIENFVFFRAMSHIYRIRQHTQPPRVYFWG